MAFYLNNEKKETVNKCIRFQKDLVKEINKISTKNNITFSSFVIQACEYALNNMETKKTKTKS